MEQQISSGFADSPKSMFLRLPAFAPSPCDATCFFGRAGFFTKKKRIQPGLEVSKLPKNPKKNIGKNRSNKKEKPISVGRCFNREDPIWRLSHRIFTLTQVLNLWKKTQHAWKKTKTTLIYQFLETQKSVHESTPGTFTLFLGVFSLSCFARRLDHESPAVNRWDVPGGGWI